MAFILLPFAWIYAGVMAVRNWLYDHGWKRTETFAVPLLNVGNLRGYDYGAEKIEGFSHTHLEGPGGSHYGYSEILVVPLRGVVKTDSNGYSSRFSHTTEQAEPGYYAVDLSGPGARAELTATRLCGVHRYTFQPGDPGKSLIDVAHTNKFTAAVKI